MKPMSSASNGQPELGIATADITCEMHFPVVIALSEMKMIHSSHKSGVVETYGGDRERARHDTNGRRRD